MLEPLVVGILGVADLVHHAECVALLAPDRLKQGNRVQNRIQRENDLGLFHPQLIRNLGDGGFPLVLAHEFFLDLKRAVRCVAHGARHSDDTVVPQIAPNFPDNHRHRVGRKPHPQIHIKIIDCLDQPDTADLEQVVHWLPAPAKALDHREHQPEVAADQLFTGGLVAVPDTVQQRVHFFRRKDGKRRGIHTANLYLELHLK